MTEVLAEILLLLISKYVIWLLLLLFFNNSKLHQKWTGSMFIPLAVRWYSFLVYFSLKFHMWVSDSTSSFGKRLKASMRWYKYFPMIQPWYWFMVYYPDFFFPSLQKSPLKTYDSVPEVQWDSKSMFIDFNEAELHFTVSSLLFVLYYINIYRDSCHPYFSQIKRILGGKIIRAAWPQNFVVFHSTFFFF